MASRIPREVESFILSHINSVEQLEILLLVKRQREAHAELINRELRTSLESVELRLSALMRKNLVSVRQEDGVNCYSYISSEKLDPIIDQLGALYQSHRVAVIDLIFSQASDALRSFSNAFRLREKD